MKKIIKVAGAIIENDNKEILCALRSNKMSMSGFWEFPGGKIESGESIQQALVREIKEELDCEISCSTEIFYEVHYEYEYVVVNLVTVFSKIISGQPKPNEHANLIWLKREYLNSLNWSPADIPIIKELAKP